MMHWLIWRVLSIVIVHKYAVHCNDPNLRNHPRKVDTHGVYVDEAREKLFEYIEDLQVSSRASLQSQITDYAISNAPHAGPQSKGSCAGCMNRTS